jgi:hypothetical protein
MIALVEAVNAIGDGMLTAGSCGGHRDPAPWQCPPGHWLLCLNDEGWTRREARRAFALLRRLVAVTPHVRLDEDPTGAALWGYPGCCPDAFARKLRGALAGAPVLAQLPLPLAAGGAARAPSAFVAKTSTRRGRCATLTATT